ncbi:MAG: nitroreductase family protein [Prolixibacteraceae bacterium]|nr:nitroreductase family protein [Prolixibacteraceae bacterium]
MDFSKLVNERYSVRKYSTKAVEDEKLELILESARKAPSAVNFQPYKIYVVSSSNKLQAVKSCYHREWMDTVPVVIVVVGMHDMAWKRTVDGKDHTDIDAAIVIDHMMLQAADLGIGTCWVCNFDIVKMRETLELKATEEPIAIIPMGYPDRNEVPVKKRKGIDELVIRI